jgi:non-ribosomal peptide synthetase component F
MTVTGKADAPTSSSSIAPLSVAQEALWYRALLAPTALTYNEAISLRKDGPLDLGALRSAFNALVARHEAWHTIFDTVDGEPVQILAPAPFLELPMLDLSHLSPEEAERHAVAVVAEIARTPYDVRRGPLLRPRLLRFSEDHHRLYLAMHHLIFDGGSLTRVILPDLVALYEAALGQRPEPPPAPAASYADFARWEQTWVTQPRFARRLEHWRRRLETTPDLSLPLDHPRPARPESRGGALELTVKADTVGALRAIARGAGGTLFQALAAAWSLLLAGHGGQDDVVFAVAADLRHRPEFQSVVGCAITPLAVRLDVSGDLTFSELVVRARNELLDGLDNVVPFERLVRALEPDATASNPIYQTMLVLEPAPRGKDPAWSVHQIDAALADAIGASKLDLELQLDERPDGTLIGRLIYDSDLFERSTAARLRDLWLALLDAAAQEPAEPVSRLSLLTPVEVHRQLTEWNATGTEWGGPSAAELARAHAERQPPPIPFPADPVLDAARALSARLDLGPADTVLVLPAMLETDPVSAVWAGLVAGARLLLADAETAGDGAAVRRLISEEDVTFLPASAAQWQALIDSGLRPVRGLRALTTDGALTRELADAILGRVRVLFNAFGMPETLGPCTLAQIERDAPLTVGRPLANTRAYVVDSHNRPVPVDAPGELLIARDGLDVGSRSMADPFATGPAFRTGHQARWRPDGQLELVPGS